MQTLELPSGVIVTLSGRLTGSDKAYLSRVLGLGRHTPTFRAWTDPEGRKGLEIALGGEAGPATGEAGGKPPHARGEAGPDF